MREHVLDALVCRDARHEANAALDLELFQLSAYAGDVARPLGIARRLDIAGPANRRDGFGRGRRTNGFRPLFGPRPALRRFRLGGGCGLLRLLLGVRKLRGSSPPASRAWRVADLEVFRGRLSNGLRDLFGPRTGRACALTDVCWLREHFGFRRLDGSQPARSFLRADLVGVRGRRSVLGFRGQAGLPPDCSCPQPDLVLT